jgi:hypothetical protein
MENSNRLLFKKNPKLGFFLSLILIGCAFLLYMKRNFLEVDKCIDAGGCWNHSDNQCELNDQCKCTPESCNKN